MLIHLFISALTLMLTASSYATVVLDPDNDGIVRDTEFQSWINSLPSGSTALLSSSYIYEFENSITIPSNITIAGEGSTKAIIRKRNDIIEGISKTEALAIKNLVLQNLTDIKFDGAGDVYGYVGLTDYSTLALEQARTVMTSYLESMQLLNDLVVTIGTKTYRFDYLEYGRRCKNNAEESFPCSGSIPAKAKRFTPFYQEIINSDPLSFTGLNKNTATPIFLLSGDNITLRNLEISCPANVPYYPVHEMVNVSTSQPHGEVEVFNGQRVTSTFNANGLFLHNASNVELSKLTINHCSNGIYSINSHDVLISDSEILTDIKPSSIRPHTNKESGDLGVNWQHRYHGINAIRIHGTQDKNFIIKNNIIGSATNGALKGIHIHGSSPSGRDKILPAGPFGTSDEGLSALAWYMDRSDESKVIRKNIIIKDNLIQGQHLGGIDLEGDLLNVIVEDNTIKHVHYQIYSPGNPRTQGGAIRITYETVAYNLFNQFGITDVYSYLLDFDGYSKNVLIESNLIEDSEQGINITYKSDASSIAYDNFPTDPITNVAGTFTCANALSGCSAQMSIIRNTIRRTTSYGLILINVNGIEVHNNIFDTCFLPLTNFDFASVVYIIKAKKIDFRSNQFQINDSNDVIKNARASLTLTGLNRYINIRMNNYTSASDVIFSSLTLSELLFPGMTNAQVQSTYNIKNVYGSFAPYSYINENASSALDEFKFVSSAELSGLGM